jgi:hypothetical protein
MTINFTIPEWLSGLDFITPLYRVWAIAAWCVPLVSIVCGIYVAMWYCDNYNYRTGNSLTPVGVCIVSFLGFLFFAFFWGENVLLPLFFPKL